MTCKLADAAQRGFIQIWSCGPQQNLLLLQAYEINKSADCCKGPEPLLQIPLMPQTLRRLALVTLSAITCHASLPDFKCILSAHSSTEVLYPPTCEKRQHQLPGPSGTDDTRQDPYYWLRDDDRKDEDVLAHLRVSVLLLTTCLKHIACEQTQLTPSGSPVYKSPLMPCRLRQISATTSLKTQSTCKSCCTEKCGVGYKKLINQLRSGTVCCTIKEAKLSVSHYITSCTVHKRSLSL